MLSVRFAVPLLPVLAACAPTLDWREVRPEGAAAVALLPCKPSVMARQVRLAGGPVRLLLHACSAGGQTWALATADLADPRRVAPALDELRAAALTNLGAGAPTPLPLTVPGATPNAGSARLALQGKLPDGVAVREQIAVFTYGTWVFQATVLGQQLPAEGVDTFFGALRVGR